MQEQASVGLTESLTFSSTSPKKFIIRTVSRFSNVYLVDAPSRDAALQIINSGIHSCDFIQKHLDETVSFIEECTTGETDVIQLKPKFINYF